MLSHYMLSNRPTSLSLKVRSCPRSLVKLREQHSLDWQELKWQEDQEERRDDYNDFNHPNYDTALHTDWRYLHRMEISPIVEVQRLV